MADYDVVIIGGGPAGLAAGIYLSRGKYRTLLIDKESYGGNIKDVEWIENYPGFSKGVGGPQLASEMVAQASASGLKFEAGEVTGLELYSSSRAVQFKDGRTYTAEAIIAATGCRRKKLGVPGERELEGKGVIGCALCDGHIFADKVAAVCGGGDSGITEALYLTKLATHVILLEALPALTATAILQERLRSNPKIEVHTGVKVTAILGDDSVRAIEYEDVVTQKKGTFQVQGVLVDIGLDPNTGFLENSVSLDKQRQVMVDERMETSAPFVFAAGDIRCDSPKQVVTAVGDGATAAIMVQRALKQ